jgi:hypothetical protein
MKSNSFDNDTFDYPPPYSPEFLERILREDHTADGTAGGGSQPFGSAATTPTLKPDQIQQVSFDDYDSDMLTGTQRKRASKAKHPLTSSSSTDASAPPPYNPAFIQSVPSRETQSRKFSSTSPPIFSRSSSEELRQTRSYSIRVAMFKASKFARSCAGNVKKFDEKYHVTQNTKTATLTTFKAVKKATADSVVGEKIRRYKENRMLRPYINYEVQI